ncbi:MAG: hypothetical protein CBE00_00255 [Planctomycetaceae bacterium TMED240]|nr:hypothetical protein [Rhodopirellula sp.]OUX09021.1 MAG: hypothetical protein CBE00_00255 [Planctomycetaceae bacterium TMED240]
MIGDCVTEVKTGVGIVSPRTFYEPKTTLPHNFKRSRAMGKPVIPTRWSSLYPKNRPKQIMIFGKSVN